MRALKCLCVPVSSECVWLCAHVCVYFGDDMKNEPTIYLSHIFDNSISAMRLIYINIHLHSIQS